MAEGATGFGTGAQGASNAGLTGLTGGTPAPSGGEGIGLPGLAANAQMSQFDALQGYARAAVRRLARGLPALDVSAKPPERTAPRPAEPPRAPVFADAADPFGGTSVRMTRMGDVDVDLGGVDTADAEAVRGASEDVRGMLGEMAGWYGKNA